MKIYWPRKRDSETQQLKPITDLGDKIIFDCPNGYTTTDGKTSQTVSCIWHRQTDLMFWWPQDVLQCNSEFTFTFTNSTFYRVQMILTFSKKRLKSLTHGLTASTSYIRRLVFVSKIQNEEIPKVKASVL